MRYLSVILWFLLGLLYYWIWSSNTADCCGQSSISNTEQIAPSKADSNSDLESESLGEANESSTDQSTDVSGMDANSTDTESASAKEEAKAKSDAEAEKAIAAAAESKEVTSVKSTTATGARKLTFYFPYGSNDASYSSSSEADLKEMVELAKSSGKKIVVSGHTDSDSSAEFNMRLGKRRADKVRTKILSMGIPSSQVQSESYGETRPIASNDTESGKQKNRRVELIIE